MSVLTNFEMFILFILFPCLIGLMLLVILDIAVTRVRDRIIRAGILSLPLMFWGFFLPYADVNLGIILGSFSLVLPIAVLLVFRVFHHNFGKEHPLTRIILCFFIEFSIAYMLLLIGAFPFPALAAVYQYTPRWNLAVYVSIFIADTVIAVLVSGIMNRIKPYLVFVQLYARS